MQKESRVVVYDDDLHIEACSFKGIMQKFPNHFHEHYVIGFIEHGIRYLAVDNREYTIAPSDMLLFNPRAPHTCWQVDGGVLDYRCLHIEQEVMADAVKEVTGRRFAPFFSEPAVRQSELVPTLRELHSMINNGGGLLRKQELFYIFIGDLINAFAEEPSPGEGKNESREISAICAFIESNYAENITLNELAALSGRGKYSLLRLFAREIGITPYRYLETIRINRAKLLLEQDEPLTEIALKTGFSDQSHFTNFFKKFIGLTPKQYRGTFAKRNRSREDIV